MGHKVWLGCLLLLCTLTGSAAAQDGEAADSTDASALDSRAQLGLVLGGKIGAGLGAPFNDFGGTPVFELELGYMPDLGSALGRQLEIFLSAQYAQPSVDGSGAGPDERLPGGEPFSYDVTQQMFSLALGALYRIEVGSDLLMPYGGLGGRMYMLRTQAEGSAGGESIGQSEETQTAFGLVLLGGVDVLVGPGALLGELSFGFTQVDSYIVRDTNLDTLNLCVGYRVML